MLRGTYAPEYVRHPTHVYSSEVPTILSCVSLATPAGTYVLTRTDISSMEG
jgi:hypothetical protein